MAVDLDALEVLIARAREPGLPMWADGGIRDRIDAAKAALWRDAPALIAEARAGRALRGACSWPDEKADRFGFVSVRAMDKYDAATGGAP